MDQHGTDWYAAALQNLTDTLIVASLQKQVMLLNSAAEQLTGWKQSDAHGKAVSEILEFSCKSQTLDHSLLLEPVFQSGLSVNIPDRTFLKESHAAEHLVTGRILPVREENGNIIGALYQLHTKSVEQSSQPKLGISEHVLHTFIENAPIAIALFDQQLRYLATSQRWLQDYGLDGEILLGRSHYEVFPEIPEHWKTAHQRALAGAVLRNEECFIRADGSLQWLRWVIQPWYESPGTIGGIVILTEDITERKTLEEENRKLLEQFAASQKMESVGRLAGGVAHDFNNMLNVILGHVGLGLLDIDAKHPLYDHLVEIRSAAERSAELTEQLLAFASRQVIEPRLLDLNETIEDMIKMLRRLIGEGIEFVWLPGASLGLVKMDPSQIDQILANLCVNASDAISGIGKITLETRNIEFDEALCQEHPGYLPGKYVQLAVSDSGSGIDQETLKNIFEPFFTTKRAGKGTGLGLATIYGIVKQNKGLIQVSSEVGSGSRFEISLPRQAAGEKTKVIKETFETPPGQNEVILLIDDEAMLARTTRDILASLGYRVLTATNPREAIQAAQDYQGTIDLLISDVVMPEMNGKDLFNTLKIIRPELKVLYISGYTVNIIADHGVLKDGIIFLQKPFSRHQLAVKVRQVIEQNKSSDSA